MVCGAVSLNINYSVFQSGCINPQSSWNFIGFELFYTEEMWKSPNVIKKLNICSSSILYIISFYSIKLIIMCTQNLELVYLSDDLKLYYELLSIFISIKILNLIYFTLISMPYISIFFYEHWVFQTHASWFFHFHGFYILKVLDIFKWSI